ncbi:MAG TPA: hypothetical protein VFF39_19220 [Verrucomicrobiae bacterium]|nr:hypothetical protein [Verrucomicrobiae bacterium]
MAALDVTKKLLIYHTLYRLNLSFSNIVKRCNTLQEAGIFSLKSAKLYQGLTQELQCEINGLLLETMHDIELDEGAHFGKVSQAREEELRSPDDLILRAKERKEESRKKQKK